MALHIQDKETDRLVREFAKQRNVGLTEAVKLAVTEASQHRADKVEDILRRLEPIWATVRANRKETYSEEDMKAFMDDMWGEND